MKLKYIVILSAVFVALAIIYFISTRVIVRLMQPEKEVIYAWDIKDSDLTRIKISLPGKKKSRSFVKITKGDQFPWFFDDSRKSPVDSKRWGGGIPLILSGPAADRIIADNATDKELALYGLARPSMEITLTLINKTRISIKAGDRTPNGNFYYVKSPYSRAVFTVDFSWYQVLYDLVINPPYEPSVVKKKK